MRNLSDECKKCDYADHWGLSMCFDCCGIPITLLENIEERNKADAEENKAIYKDTDSVHTRQI